jgi:hypothetical protein
MRMNIMFEEERVLMKLAEIRMKIVKLERHASGGELGRTGRWQVIRRISKLNGRSPKVAPVLQPPQPEVMGRDDAQQPSTPRKEVELSSPPTPAMSVIAFTLKLAGDMFSFTPFVQLEIRRAIAAEAGVQPSAVEVAVTSGSVLVDVTIHAPTATADSVQSKMVSATWSTSSATEMLSSVTGVEITVTKITKPASWTPDKMCNACQICKLPFSKTDPKRARKHHCRHCGRCVCSECTPKKMAIPKFGSNAQERVCLVCERVLQIRPREGSVSSN